MSYYCVTCHFIDKNWSLQKIIIAFRMMEYPHSGQSIYAHVMNVFREYGISDKNLALHLTMLELTILLLRFLDEIYIHLMVVNFIILDVVVI